MEFLMTNLNALYQWVFVESIHIVGGYLLTAVLFMSFIIAMTIYGNTLMYFLQLFIAIIPPVFILIMAVLLAISFTCLIAIVSFYLFVMLEPYPFELQGLFVFFICLYFLGLMGFALYLSFRAMNYTKNKNFYKWYFTTKFFKSLTFHKRLRLNWNLFRSNEDYLHYKDDDRRGLY